MVIDVSDVLIASDTSFGLEVFGGLFETLDYCLNADIECLPLLQVDFILIRNVDCHCLLHT